MSGEIIEAEVTRHEQQNQSLSVPQSMGSLSTVTRESLDEYANHRLMFRKWLFEQLKQGVHYGTPPGCGRSSTNEWVARPCLYHAGAQLIADLHKWRPEYDSDQTTWEMLGKPENTFVRRCRLYRQSGELVGEGAGARVNGEKKMNLNASLKMADKSAMVAAVINTANIADLFTQDLDDIEQQQAEQPKPRDDAPVAQPRGDRVAKEDVGKLTSLLKDYLASRGSDNSEKDVQMWLVHNGFFAMPDDAKKLSNWTREKCLKLNDLLGQLTNGN